MTSFPVATLVVVVGLTVARGTAFSDHVGSAMTAEQFGTEQIVFFGFCFGTSCIVVFQHSLHFIEKLFIKDGWNTSFDDHIVVLIDADILLVLQDRP